MRLIAKKTNRGSEYVPWYTVLFVLFVLVPVGLAPHVLAVAFPKIKLFGMLSERPVWYVYLIFAYIGLEALHGLIERLFKRK